MPWFQERRTRYTSCVPPIPTCSIWFAFNNSYFFCDSLVCYISSANMKASEVSEALKTWKVQKQVLQHCTWKKNMFFLAIRTTDLMPTWCFGSIVQIWCMDSVKLINFGRTYTSVISLYAFLIAAASSSHVYASFANTGSRSRKWRMLF